MPCKEFLEKSASLLHTSATPAFASVLTQAQKDSLTADFSSDRSALWSLGLSCEFRVPDIRQPPIDIMTLKSLYTRLERHPAGPVKRLIANTSKPVQPFSAPVQRPLLSRSQTEDLQVGPSTFSKVKDLLSVWGGHISTYKEKAFKANTPVRQKLSATNTSFFDAEGEEMNEEVVVSCQVTPVVPGRRSVLGEGTRRLKLQPIGEPKEEDNYAITEKGTDSEGEEEQAAKRRAKKIPEWCKQWREQCMKQSTIDPESIFGINIPNCDLSAIFTENNYARMHKTRPKRIRGSSGNWKMDKLKQDEIDIYRSVCGQTLQAQGVFL
jgi:hypothetical protein